MTLLSTHYPRERLDFAQLSPLCSAAAGEMATCVVARAIRGAGLARRIAETGSRRDGIGAVENKDAAAALLPIQFRVLARSRYFALHALRPLSKAHRSYTI
jgi:hypothetical protein